MAADCGGQDAYANAPRLPVKNSENWSKSGKMSDFDQKGQSDALENPGTLDWGHLNRHSAPRNPPPLKSTASFVVIPVFMSLSHLKISQENYEGGSK